MDEGYGHCRTLHFLPQLARRLAEPATQHRTCSQESHSHQRQPRWFGKRRWRDHQRACARRYRQAHQHHRYYRKQKPGKPRHGTKPSSCVGYNFHCLQMQLVNHFHGAARTENQSLTSNCTAHPCAKFCTEDKPLPQVTTLTITLITKVGATRKLPWISRRQIAPVTRAPKRNHPLRRSSLSASSLAAPPSRESRRAARR